MRLTWFEHAIYGLKARCHTAWLQTQIDILFSAFRLLFSFGFSHYFQSSCLSFFFLYVPDIYVGNISWHGGTRTHDTLVNGQALYLAELRANISLRAKTFTRQSHTAKAICQMEHTGIEPVASCLQNRRRPIATNAPYSPAAFLPAYLTYMLYTFSTPFSNLTVILSGYPDG